MHIIGGQNNQKDDIGPANKTLAIFLISILGLFLEMLFIRWISTEVRIFAYMQNTVLVVCFMGLGLGCFTSRQPIVLRQMLLPLFFLVLLFAIPITRKILGQISEMLSVLGGLPIWYGVVNTNLWETILSVVVGLSLTYFLMVMIVDIFVPIGRLLGRLMDDHPITIWAYSVNVAGSLIGIWLFVLMSFFYQPPVTWFAVMGVLTFFWLDKTSRRWKVNLTLMIAIIAISWFAGKNFEFLQVVWSPYQKLAIKKANHKLGIDGYTVTVNNVGFQNLTNLSDSNIKLNPQRYSPEMRGLSSYDVPLLLHPNPKTYLIVGAGGGNDAAGGIRHGINQITAVEIDPAIISLGRRYHPEKPYSSPIVQVVEDDARSFFATSKKHYDVISFGYLDSHTTTGMTNARLDDYVFTRESIACAKSLLADGGVLVLKFAAQNPYISDRIASIIRDVFGEEPISFRVPLGYYGGGITFITGDLVTAKRQIAKHEKLASLIKKWQKNAPLSLTYTTKISTDDWPYFYLKKPAIPIIYFLLAGLMVILLIRCYRHWHADGLISKWKRSHWHFFFLGAAFLLLEVQNISKASVVLGNTWQVNAVIVSGVLGMILLANLVAYRFPHMPLGIVYVVLIAICLALYFVDLARFAFLPYAIKAVIVGCLTTLPMLFSGIVFIRSFAVAVGKDQALGANLIGALVGALLQSVTFVIGIKALLLIVAGFYFLSMLTKPRTTEKDQTQIQPMGM